VRERAGCGRQFQTRPFFVAEPWTARPGEAVELEGTLSECSTIAAGGAEGLSDDDLLYVGRPPRHCG